MNRLKIAAIAALVLLMSFKAVAAPKISPAKKALIDELILVSNAHFLAAGFLVEKFGPNMAATDKPPDAFIADLSKKLMNDPEGKQVMNESFVPAYDSAFTEAELRQLLAFFKGDLGRKYANLNRDLGLTGRRNIVSAVIRTPSEGSPESRTMAELRALATASEVYAIDNNKYPAATNMKELEAILSPVYIRTLPKVDAWDKPLVYAVTKDLQTYRFVSGGPDGKIEPANRQCGSKEKKKNDDLIYENGAFVQAPAKTD